MEEKEIILNLEKEGEKFTFYSDPDCDALAVEFNNVLALGAKGPEPHIHTVQTETFHVVTWIVVEP